MLYNIKTMKYEEKNWIAFLHLNIHHFFTFQYFYLKT